MLYLVHPGAGHSWDAIWPPSYYEREAKEKETFQKTFPSRKGEEKAQSLKEEVIFKAPCELTPLPRNYFESKYPFLASQFRLTFPSGYVTINEQKYAHSLREGSFFSSKSLALTKKFSLSENSLNEVEEEKNLTHRLDQLAKSMPLITGASLRPDYGL